VKMLILGCGPAGLLAAHAASFMPDVEIKVVSKKRPSELFGCQYLHGPIPGLILPTTTVHYLLNGTEEGYATKVYGSRLMAGQVSPAALHGTHPAWDLREAYRQLYDWYESSIEDCELYPDTIPDLLTHLQPDLTISSIPLPVLCQREEHAFRSQDCWALGDAPERGQSVPVPCPADTIVCNGDPDTGWYRVSNVFGYKTAEWPGLRPRPPFTGVVPFSKPLATTCDCWQPDLVPQANPSILRVGRYGTWTKGVLSHEAFNRTIAVLNERVSR